VQVDWLTVAAQWVNFLILVWLLKRFLYGPIIRAMDRRQKNIETSMAEAADRARQAEQAATLYRDKLLEVEEDRAVLFAEVRAEAACERERLLERARVEVEAVAQHWRRAVDLESKTFQDQLRLELGRLLVAAARKALLNLASLELEHALLANFLERLQRLPEQDKRLLSESGDGSVVLASSAELSEDWRTRLSEAISRLLGRQLTVKFEPLPESNCGLMLITPAYTLEWTLENYFEDFGSAVEAAMSKASLSRTAAHAE
jgi:F-type H+-transporting ATPase subunit b